MCRHKRRCRQPKNPFSKVKSERPQTFYLTSAVDFPSKKVETALKRKEEHGTTIAALVASNSPSYSDHHVPYIHLPLYWFEPKGVKGCLTRLSRKLAVSLKTADWSTLLSVDVLELTLKEEEEEEEAKKKRKRKEKSLQGAQA